MAEPQPSAPGDTLKRRHDTASTLASDMERLEADLKRALVLAGGGVAGIAWELGILRGIADVDADLCAALIAADVIVGTSAGSSVAAQITSGVPLAELYAAQVGAASREIAVDVDLEALMARFVAVTAEATTAQDLRQRIGALAVAALTVDEAVRRAAIAARLPTPHWPDRVLLLPAVDVETGEAMIFTRDSGVALVDAVAASCAVPGVWPPVTINGRRYMDGGVRSLTNADLAAGCARVVVLSPAPANQPAGLGARLEDEMALLTPAEVAVIDADAAAVAAFGTNPLSPATRKPAAEAGRDLGRREAPNLARLWR